MAASRRSPRRRGPALGAGGSVAGAAAVGFGSGVALAVAVFLPWYATNLGPPFSATSASGWESTNLARIALVMGVLLAAAAAAVILGERGVVDLDPRSAEWLAWAVLVTSAVALLAVGYRLVVMPEPAEFLSRQIGLYLATAAAVGGLMSGLGQVAGHR